MCEPMHSIVQFPDRDDDDNPTKIDHITPPPGSDPSIWEKLKKKISEWYHFSCMGSGHSEALQVTAKARVRLPQDSKYEAAWWERKVTLDGYYYGIDFQKPYALQAATDYANKVSIGNLTLFRQFLEWSLRKSDRPNVYKEAFGLMLNPKGRDEFRKKMRMYIGTQICQENLESAIKVLLGFTRKRDLLVPEWADDTKLWTPKIVLG
jgi:hypothetical protein